MAERAAADEPLKLPGDGRDDDVLWALGEEQQLVMDFSAPNHADGLRKWKSEKLERLQKISRLWKLPLGKTVRVELIAGAEALEGRLILTHAPESLTDLRAPLGLRVATTTFSSHEILSLVKLD